MSMPTPTSPQYVEVDSTPTAVVRRKGYPINQLEALMDQAFTALGSAIAAGQFVPAGPPFSRYDTEITDEVNLSEEFPVDLEVGFPVMAPLTADIEAEGQLIVASELPAGRLAKAVHVGAYEELTTAWGEFAQAVAEAGQQTRLPFWEAYLTEPTVDGDPAENQTELVLLLAN